MKKVLLFIALLITMMSAYYYFKSYKTSSEKEKYQIEVTKIFYAQIGAYKNEENVSKVTKNLKNYAVEKVADTFHIYVGVSMHKENTEKIKDIYTKNGSNIYIREDLTSNESLINAIKKYDDLLLITYDKDTVLEIEKEILNKYNEVVK